MEITLITTNGRIFFSLIYYIYTHIKEINKNKNEMKSAENKEKCFKLKKFVKKKLMHV